jgi:hypothetical protein
VFEDGSDADRISDLFRDAIEKMVGELDLEFEKDFPGMKSESSDQETEDDLVQDTIAEVGEGHADTASDNASV